MAMRIVSCVVCVFVLDSSWTIPASFLQALMLSVSRQEDPFWFSSHLGPRGRRLGPCPSPPPWPASHHHHKKRKREYVNPPPPHKSERECCHWADLCGNTRPPDTTTRPFRGAHPHHSHPCTMETHRTRRLLASPSTPPSSILTHTLPAMRACALP